MDLGHKMRWGIVMMTLILYSMEILMLTGILTSFITKLNLATEKYLDC